MRNFYSRNRSCKSVEHLEEPDIWYRFLPLGQIPRTGEGVNHLELLSLVGVLKVSTGWPDFFQGEILGCLRCLSNLGPLSGDVHYYAQSETQCFNVGAST